MVITRSILEAQEDASLAPYAQKVSQSAGRRHPEHPHPYRTAYQRDRARIIHSQAFRRLEYKTQVFLNGTGDHLRTRLTHTIEVASVSRTIACALGLNADLAEVIALAHDLGHAPFGHSGEKKLNEIMQDFGGFDHNLQSLRMVERVEGKYPDFPGLNLSYEVLEGLHKHKEGYHRPSFNGVPEESFLHPSPEAQVADLADEITYYSHDLDDGLDHRLISPEQLENLEIWRMCSEDVRRYFPNLTGDRFHSYLIRVLIDRQVDDLIRETEKRIRDSRINTADDVRRWPRPLVAYSPGLARANLELRRFLYRNLYDHPEVSGPNQRGTEKIATVFKHYIAHPENLGDSTSVRLTTEGLHRTVCDYVSGMTDLYLSNIYENVTAGKNQADPPESGKSSLSVSGP